MNTEVNTQEVKLWNPDIAGVWSIFLSPVFGSVIILLNWKILGNDRETSIAWVWLVISLLALISMSILELPLASNLVFVITWYFAWQKKQTVYLKNNHPAYIKKSWIAPVILGIILLVLFSLIIGIILTYLANA